MEKEVYVKYKDFEFYSNRGLERLLVSSYMDNDPNLSDEIIKELKVRVNVKPDYLMSRDRQIKIILEEVNFEKIHQVMEFTKWTWFSTGSKQSPTVDEIKSASIKLLEDVWECEEGIPIVLLGTGGLVATREIYDGKRSLELRFDITSWGFDNDDIQSPNYDGDY
jgi:hypothetical protein|tara:strand:- start:293 stop:787 length:495 start_codon:yes stop_codon:yes gene_type:complete